MADFIAEALCATMGRGFSECFRKDIAVAVPDYIAIGLLLVIGKFGDGWGHSPYWFRWLFGVPTASSIYMEPNLTILSERIFRGESYFQDNERRLYLSQSQYLRRSFQRSRLEIHIWKTNPDMKRMLAFAI